MWLLHTAADRMRLQRSKRSTFPLLRLTLKPPRLTLMQHAHPQSYPSRYVVSLASGVRCINIVTLAFLY